jgi:glutaredoxin
MAERHFLSLPVWLRAILTDPFKKHLILFLCFLGLGIYITEQYLSETVDSTGQQIVFFFHRQCPHCQEQKKFNPYLKAKYPELHWAEYDTSIQENAKLLAEFVQRTGLNPQHVGVPVTFIGPYVISGFDAEDTTGIALEKAVQAYIHNDPSLYEEATQDWQDKQTVGLPILGEIKYAEYSLFSLAVILGLVDGFNPCAMWVLVYLISLILTLKDRRKIWLLVGTFVGASGILYFLFMTAWLNAFLFLGYLRILTLLIGLFATGFGILSVREYLQTKGELMCKIGNTESKKKTMGQIDRIVQAPLTFFTLFNIIVLAFIINSIEFACSAALPAIFTHTLTLRALPTLQYYAYILLYDFFFMLDDLIIFSLAVLALNTNIGQRYAKYCKIIGGIILLSLGGIMMFNPGLLR